MPVPLAPPRTRFILHRMGELATATRNRAWAQIPDAETLREQAIRARDTVLADLPGHLARLEEAATAHNVTVHHAQSPEEANRLILETLRSLEAQVILHNHHPLLDELHLDQAARLQGIPITPLHPGDHLAWLAQTRPGHPVWPVGHLSVEEISDILHAQLRTPKTYDPDHLASMVRMPLRRTLLQVDAAVMVAHFAAAREGVLVFLDNDGHNASLLSLARHVVMLLSVELMAAHMEDVQHVIRVFALSAWGRPWPAYVSYVHSPAPAEEDGPRTLHLILVDHGRSRIIAQGFGQALRCIHCGACHTVCPVYQQIGAAGYGETAYSGPIGTVLNPLLLDTPEAQEQTFLCHHAGLCMQTCPLEIPFEQLRQAYRQAQAQNRRRGWGDRVLAPWRRRFGRRT